MIEPIIPPAGQIPICPKSQPPGARRAAQHESSRRNGHELHRLTFFGGGFTTNLLTEQAQQYQGPLRTKERY